MADHLLVIRAGSTAYDLDGRLRGTLDMPLAPAGVEQAKRIAADLSTTPPAMLFAADDGPSLETAHIIGAACGLRPRAVADLGNLDLGLWQGLLVDEIRRKQPRLYRQWLDNPWSVVPPEGETLEDACARIDDVIGRLLRRRIPGLPAVVVPRPLDRLVLWVVAGRPTGDLWAEQPAAAAVTSVPVSSQWQPGGRGVSVA